MNALKFLATFVFSLWLVGCGGGGGSGGTNSSKSPTSDSSGGVVASSSLPLLQTSLLDISNAVTNSISASGYTVVRVTVTDPSGNPLPNQVVNVSGDASKVIFPEGNGGLTSAAGIATVKVARASLFATGADSLTVTYSYKAGLLTKFPDGSTPPSTDTVVSSYIGYQLAAANITLTNLDVGTTNLPAYGTRQISVQANINGIASSTTPVQVSFSANCGAVSPSTASTDSNGVVKVSYSAINALVTNDQGCGGSSATITASTVNASPVSGNIAVSLAPATNLLFVSASPALIYLSGSGGATQSVVKFKVVNASNAALQGQNVQLELKDLAGGIPRATFGTVGNISMITLPTNSNGEVSVPVFSGTVPASVQVKATLSADGSVTTTSAVLAIASGRPVQARTTLSAIAVALEDRDGTLGTVVMSLADRQGNPVPDGTAVNFVTEGGLMIPPACTTVGSECRVSVRVQNPKPVGGRVSILAYAAGEEDFTDLNFDNVYTPGEPFQDLGNAFRDDAAVVSSASGVFVPGYFSVPRAGAVACAGGLLGRPGSCDGVWGAADVRQQIVVVFASSGATITGSFQPSTAGVRSALDVVVQDANGNSMPTNSTVGITTGSSLCQVTNSNSITVNNSLGPLAFTVTFAGCVVGDVISVKVTTPAGIPSTKSFVIPTDPLTVSSGSTTTVNSANIATFRIIGGVAPYSVFSGNSSVATASVSGQSLFISGVAPGTANLTVTDAAGTRFLIAVTVN